MGLVFPHLEPLAFSVGHRQNRNRPCLASRRLSSVLDPEGATGPTWTTPHFPRGPRSACPKQPHCAYSGKASITISRSRPRSGQSSSLRTTGGSCGRVGRSFEISRVPGHSSLILLKLKKTCRPVCLGDDPQLLPGACQVTAQQPKSTCHAVPVLCDDSRVKLAQSPLSWGSRKYAGD